ncbi:ATP-binding protein [Flavobacterium sp.]|uniref:sensor histidine kinase n=1 Tax=Flavobacterium sp. TaxID=239 RepID=UPI0025C267E7|nr:ATP-binding protein [Flavobacterium sp.]
MRAFVLRLLFSIVAAKAVAQDVETLSQSGIDPDWGMLNFRTSEWLFKKGNDKTWAKPDFDTRNWQKIYLDSLYEYADADGKLEGWLRLKIKIHRNLKDMPLRIYSWAWGASDVYIDGKLIKSFGNTGSNGAPFQEYNFYTYETAPVMLEAGKEYVLAWHFVDYRQPLGIGLRSSNIPAKYWLFLGTIDYEKKFYQDRIISRTFDGVLISVTVVLSLMFWFLAFLIPLEKNLKWIATGSSLLALLSISIAFSRTGALPYFGNYFFSYIKGMWHILIFILNPIILANLFNRKIHRNIKILLVVCAIVAFGCALLPVDLSQNVRMFAGISIVLSLVMSLLISIYYVVTSWKMLRGAQWAPVIAFVVSILSLTAYFVGLASATLSSWVSVIPFVMAFTLSPSLGMLVYVSLRFVEILREVRSQNEIVLQLSEEKRFQAENQQKVLEAEVDRQTHDLKQTLSELKSTQSQLIQAEKMASLGELTAGIAHEIQNPLNFVNNFSDVSNELVDEILVESQKSKVERDDELISENLHDIKQNLSKIAHHGKRADAIVKGMLQHSRTTSGEKELTNLNVLADEYLRLAYHGLRAKDKSFNAELITNFDANLPKVKVIPQDVGRVLLNLITNAFYATQERSKFEGESFKPIVEVSTSSVGNNIEISVKDNGNGIPEAIKEKIFQPFFTTKPTGEGTGLGLSLAYDIVKAHGGELQVETIEGESTTFIISIAKQPKP